MSSETAVAKFTFFWKIGWAEFKELSTKCANKFFITACNNVALQWRAIVCCNHKETKANKFSFHLHYIDGPLAELNGINYSVDLTKSGNSVLKWKTKSDKNVSKLALARGYGRGWFNFDKRDIQAFQSKHNLSDADSLHYRIILEIPISIFSFSENLPAPLASASWSHTCFQQIEDPEKSLFSNAKLISKEGTIFYCHELVLGRQSEVLAAMFRHPKGRNTKQGEYDFPALSTNGLRALLEFLYTGQATLTNTATKEILETADAAEQYGLKILKQMCLARLWKFVVDKPKDCFIVARFSDLHDDWKYLEDRAMDVLTVNFENMGLQSMNLKSQFGGGERGERLRKEFALYGYRRVMPYFLEEDEGDEDD